MLHHLDTALNDRITEPKYCQVARLIEGYLTSYRVPPGTRLPSERRLAEHFGITSVTVNRGLNELVKRGILERKVGSGSYTTDLSSHLRIGIVCHEETMISDYYTGTVLKSLHQYWEGRADLISIVLRPEEYEATIHKYYLSGLVVLSVQEEFIPQLLQLRQAGYSLVTIGVALPQLGSISFGTDHRLICRQAVQYLISHGCRRIGMLSVNNRKTAVLERERGYTKAMYEAGLPVDPDWIIRRENYHDDFPREQICSIMQRKDRPRAFLIAAYCDFMPFYNLMQDLHLRIPEDISVIGFDDPDYACFLNPPITVFKQPIEDFTRNAAEQLENLILNRQTRDFPRCDGIVIERESCLQASGKQAAGQTEYSEGASYHAS
ncbi:MAG: GntR family transcriptional regulator [Lentisphaeria bacterium]